MPPRETCSVGVGVGGEEDAMRKFSGSRGGEINTETQRQTSNEVLEVDEGEGYDKELQTMLKFSMRSGKGDLRGELCLISL